ncbi:NAD-dependent succinate-semialdehyde dehydrogenase [Opitutaceae bacterium]
MPFVSINPATARTIRRYRAHTRGQIQEILAHTHAAFLGWRELARSERIKHLHALASQLRRERDSLADLIVTEMGKPLAQARLEIEKCAATCDHYARYGGRSLKPERPPGAPKHAQIVFEPLGVLLAIMPWNYPFWQVFRAAAPALLSGNTMLLKHAPNATGCALAIEEVVRRAGLPSGVLRTVLAETREIPAVIADPRIRAVTLTGSTRAGRAVGALAGAALKPCVFELGGSDPYLVLADADVDKAAAICATARLINGGQSCISAKRMIVVESVRKAFETRLVAEFARRSVGDPTRAETDVGPIARDDLRRNLHRQVTASVRAGAQLLAGGTLPRGPGFFYPLTILSGVRPGMPAHDEELFGPVAAIISVPDTEAAIATANATSFGLGGAVFTRNRRLGETIARERLDVGMAFVNDFVRSDPHLPFGGVKESGYGRELGEFGVRTFVNAKTLWVR